MPDYHPPAAAWPVGAIHCSARLKTRPHLPPEMDKINDDGWAGGNMTVQYLRSVGLLKSNFNTTILVTLVALIRNCSILYYSACYVFLWSHFYLLLVMMDV